MTTDEELSMLEEHVRRLKVEYDVYFGGGSKKPPSELEWKVKNLLKKFSDGTRMNYTQRFRYTTIQQRYALYNTLWQQKLQIKEEGYRRPQDAVLGIQGIRSGEQHDAEKAIRRQAGNTFSVSWSNPQGEGKKVDDLFQVLAEARQRSGEKNTASLESFRKFVQQKTAQIRKEYGCDVVEYSVETKNGQVKLKARPKS